MRKNIVYRVLNIGLRFGLSCLSAVGVARAQQYVPTTPNQADLYCSGVVTDKPVPNDSYIITGEDARNKTTFFAGDHVYINRGAENGVKMGDKFEVVRPIRDEMATAVWFKYQTMLSRAMGTRYADIGRLRIVHVDQKTSTAETEMGCDPMQRGDIVRPFEVRPAPQFHDVKFDPFAAPSGKKTAMIVSGKDYATLESRHNCICQSGQRAGRPRRRLLPSVPLRGDAH